jgi:hypothetical protein
MRNVKYKYLEKNNSNTNNYYFFICLRAYFVQFYFALSG